MLEKTSTTWIWRWIHCFLILLSPVFVSAEVNPEDGSPFPSPPWAQESAFQIVGEGWAVRPVESEAVPAFAQGVVGQAEQPEHVLLLVYELEEEQPGGELETFVDSQGQTLFQTWKPAEDDDKERSVELKDLSSQTRSQIDRFRQGNPLTRLQFEVEWGAEILAARWQGPDGRQEVKLLLDGRLLFLELPPTQPIPERIRHLAASREIEALIFEGYRSSAGGPVILSSGRVVSPSNPSQP